MYFLNLLNSFLLHEGCAGPLHPHEKTRVVSPDVSDERVYETNKPSTAHEVIILERKNHFEERSKLKNTSRQISANCFVFLCGVYRDFC